MNLTWHIIKKDLVRLRLPVLLWVFILASEVYVSNSMLSIRSVDFNWFYQMDIFVNLLFGVGLVVTYILVAMLVLDDPLTGTNMFWITRPIAGVRLLCAKVMTALLVFGLLPLLVWLPWWLYCSFGLGAIGRASGTILSVQVLVMVLAFTMAALVDQISRFLLFSIVMVFAGLVITLDRFSHTEVLSDLNQSRLVLALGTLVISGVLVTGWQYRTRRIVSASITMIAAVVVAVVILFAWPLNVTEIRPEKEQAVGTERITATIADIDSGGWVGKPLAESTYITISLRFMGVPNDLDLSGGLADVELIWPDGFTFRQERLKLSMDGYEGNDSGNSSLPKALGLISAHPTWPYKWDPETAAKIASDTEQRWERLKEKGLPWYKPGNRPEGTYLSVTLETTPEISARIKSTMPACSISARIEVQAPVVLQEMPLRAGTQIAKNGARVHILSMETGRQKKPPIDNIPTYRTTMVAVNGPGRKNDLSFYVTDRKNGILDSLSINAAHYAFHLAANMECAQFYVSPTIVWRTDKWVEVPGSIESMSLVVVTHKPLGGFNRNLHTDQLVPRVWERH
jgi:hypothetical protein